jgi:hypothetical protein
MVTVDPVLQTRLVAPPLPAPASLEQRFTVGGVVSKTMSVWWKHLGAFTLMSFVTYVPISLGFAVLLWQSFMLSGRRSADAAELRLFASIGIALLGGSLLTMVLTAIQTGAITYATVRHLQGARARLGEMLGVAFRRALPVVAVSFLLGLGFFGGTLLLLVPGIMFLVASSVAMPAAVVERPGIFASFSRSYALTRGNRWSLFAAGFVILVIMWVFSLIIQLTATIGVTLALGPERGPIAAVAVSQLGNAFFSAIPLVAISVAYHDLRVAKEGVDTASLAAVFE